MRTVSFLTLALVLFGCKDDTKPDDSTIADDSAPPDDSAADDSAGPTDADGDGSPATEDCDDNDATRFPGNPEICDGVDNNCDEVVDEGVMTTWYADADQDGHGDPSGNTTESCDSPGDGWASVADDCDDNNATVYPDAPERCDEIDNDCDTFIDEDVLTQWFHDADHDGYGDLNAPLESCDPPEDYVASSSDCDDSVPSTYPGAPELCNGIDDDCDGTIDNDATDPATWYQDTDSDGYGDTNFSITSCEQPNGYVADNTDCDDNLVDVHPDATEYCNSIDDDCDTFIDEDDAADASTWYYDTDGDSFGDAGNATLSCTQPSGTVSDGTDCDDNDVNVNPSATEYCNGVDDDCDNTTDESDAADAATWYRDTDHDNYGDANRSQTACTQPGNHWLSDSSDCDDNDANVYPNATEVCNSIDDDCDTFIDEDDAADASTWYADTDGDGYGDPDVSSLACAQPSGASADNTDCDDNDSGTFPGASEICDGSDNDCDTVPDNGVLGSGNLCPGVSCLEILNEGSSTGDGDYYLEGASAGVFQTHCDMTSDGGGWTLIGSLANEGARSWNSYDVWTDTTTFGALSDRQAADFKGDAFYDVTGDDFLVHTPEYSFAFYTLVGSQDFATFIAAEYTTSACNTTYAASGADWSDLLSASQAALQSFIVRPWDNNASCFPNGNENAIIGNQLASCCWVPGMGNTPSGYPTWQTYDLSLLKLNNLTPATCTAGSYPCNDAGYWNTTGSNCYTETCKVSWAEMYVR